MIDALDARLSGWVSEKLTGVPVTLEPPADGGTGEGVSLYLIELAPRPDERVERNRTLTASLRYLVTSWAPRPERAHELLGTLLLAALGEPEFEVDLAPVDVTAWAAFRLAPRPSFVVRVPLRQDLKSPQAKLVRRPLDLRASGVVPLNGTVLGPDDVPVASASVELPTLQLATVTDWKGRFHFPAVPADPPPKELLVKARGLEQRVAVEQAGAPVLIHFGPLED
ncbi:MAG TPA: carboxypeptidase-like regulatory domain-containing protein [Candidatus Dormibacteraeota bacterium]|nr:carboxypeptidase-like regulatory domain-containing protein [Candidatus Dormibacteraeota bacterium]